MTPARAPAARPRAAVAAVLVAAEFALAAPAGASDHPLAGRIWDTRSERFVAEEDLYAHAARARHVLLGETHDNAEHHRLQRRVLEALARLGPPRALAMEQFDAEHGAALAQAIAAGADAERVAEAGRFDRAGWDWPLYRPLVEFALAARWPILAANLSRAEARRIMQRPELAPLAPAPAQLAEALARDLVESHCGESLPPARLAAMVEAQRARDARLAHTLETADRPTVLVTGNGHARRDRGVALYLRDPSAVVSIAFLEVRAGLVRPADYYGNFVTRQSFDYLWFTPRQPRRDPCAQGTLPHQPASA